jgi:biopolymer transport protein ExbB/TolQ
MNFSGSMVDFINNSVYFALALDAAWGLYCAVLVFMRISQQRFRNEKKQDEFLDGIEAALDKGDFDGAADLCENDRRALPQLVALALSTRKRQSKGGAAGAHPPVDMVMVQELLVDRFQRDVLSDLEHRTGWINNVIKTAPMLGLLGTVLGMMAAFGKLATSQNVKPDQLAEDISFALITTALGLTTAIPLTITVASINIRVRKLEDLIGAGLNRFLDSYAAVQKKFVKEG